MHTSHINRLFTRLNSVLALCMLLASPLAASPKLRSVVLKQGNGTVKASGFYAYLCWKIENPDDTEQTATLQLTPKAGQMDTIYSTTITVPPKSFLESITPIIAPKAEEVLCELIQKGSVVDKDTALLKPGGRHSFLALILNDGDALSSTTRIRRDNGKLAVRDFNSSTCLNAAMHWSEYETYDAVILAFPDLKRYTEMQFNAILDYVNHGGTLIVGTPECAMEMAGTPLKRLLPYEPAGLFSFEGYAEFSAEMGDTSWKEAPDLDENGFDSGKPSQVFLNAIPAEGTRVLFSVGPRPAAVIKRHGCGTVLGLCFNVFDTSNVNPSLIARLWEMLEHMTTFSGSTGRLDDTANVNSTLQMLQGYRIPSEKFIGAYLLAYALAGALVLAIFFKMKRHGAGWLAMVLLAFAFTALIIWKSRGIADMQTNFSMTNISLGTWDGVFGPSRNDTLLLSKNDIAANVDSQASRVFLHAMPRAENSQRTAMASVPLWLTVDKDRQSLNDMTLQQLRPRTLRWSISAAEHSHGITSLPSLKYAEGKVLLDEWELPPELSGATRAMLAMPNGIRPLDISGGRVRDSGAEASIEADTVFTSAMDIIRHNQRRTPVLVLLMPATDSIGDGIQVKAGEGKTAFYDYRLTSVQVRFPEGIPDEVPREFSILRLPQESMLRTYRRNGEWHEINSMLTSTTHFDMDICLPPEMTDCHPGKIVMELDIFSPGGKIEFSGALVALDGTEIKPSRVDGSRYTFETGSASLVDPFRYSFKFRILARPTKEMTVIDSRAMAWTINGIHATVVNRSGEGK